MRKTSAGSGGEWRRTGSGGVGIERWQPKINQRLAASQHLAAAANSAINNGGRGAGMKIFENVEEAADKWRLGRTRRGDGHGG